MEKKFRILTFIALVAIIIALFSLDDEIVYSASSVKYEMIPFDQMIEHTMDVKWQEYQDSLEEETGFTPYDFISLKDEYQIYLEQRCAEYDLDFFLMASLMFSESSFRAKAVGDNGKSIGLFQINKVWWNEMADKGLDVNNPFDNIEIGCIIFREDLDKADGDIEKAIQYYKCGAKRGKRLWNEGKKLSSISGIIDRADDWRNK